jgi:hypothetical protein
MVLYLLGLSLVDQVQTLVYHLLRPQAQKMIHNNDKSTVLPQAKAL